VKKLKKFAYQFVVSGDNGITIGCITTVHGTSIRARASVSCRVCANGKRGEKKCCFHFL
jgi:hypothetical protein